MDDNELRQAAKILDKLLTCKDENVKESLRELLVMVTLLEKDEGDGPLIKALDRAEEANNRISRMEHEMYRMMDAFRGRRAPDYPNSPRDIHWSRGSQWTVSDDEYRKFFIESVDGSKKKKK